MSTPIFSGPSAAAVRSGSAKVATATAAIRPQIELETTTAGARRLNCNRVIVGSPCPSSLEGGASLGRECCPQISPGSVFRKQVFTYFTTPLRPQIGLPIPGPPGEVFPVI